MYTFFHLTENASEYYLEINLQNTRLNIADGNKISLPLEMVEVLSGKRVTVSGRAPLWLYMYVALQVYQYGASEILIKQAQDTVAVKIFPCSSGCEPSSPITLYGTFEKTLVFEYLCSRNNPVTPEELPDLLHVLPEKNNLFETIVISGKIPNYLAGAAAIEAWRKGWRNIECFVPQEGGTAAVIPDIHRGGEFPELKSPGVIIGVIGDPNSGKSVFSELLEQSGNAAGETLWRFDCDYAAPTPNWYLDMIKNQQEKEGKELRSTYKGKWVPGAEEELVAQLLQMRKYIPTIIADLPGGLHKKDLVQRIPAGREILLKAIDYFIIVAKNSNGFDTGIAWQNELKTIEKEDAVILTIYSEHPENPTVLTFDCSVWHITGLDRAGKPVSTEIKKQLWQLVMDSIHSREIPGKSELDNK